MALNLDYDDAEERIDPDVMERKRMLRRLRDLVGQEYYDQSLAMDGEDALYYLARIFWEYTPYERFNYASSGVTLGEMFERLYILERMRTQLGNEQYWRQFDRLGEDGLVELGYEMLEKSIERAKHPPRTREAGNKVNLIVLLVSVAYGAYSGASYPDASAFSLSGDLASWIFGGMAVIGFLGWLFFRASIDTSALFVWAFIISAVITTGVGLIFNLSIVGVKTLLIAGLAFALCYMIGMVIGRPVFRWLEAREQEWQKWVFGFLAVMVGLGVMYLISLLVRVIFPV